jgi:hypothetical protein
MNESKTPLTDAEVNDTALENKNHPHTDWVTAHFARSLELQLVEAKNALMVEKNDGVTDKFNHLCDERNQLAARVVELEKALKELIALREQLGNPSLTPIDKRRFVALEELLRSSPSTALQHLQDLERKAKALDWLNTVDGMDWFSYCEYGDATLEAIEAAMKEK